MKLDEFCSGVRPACPVLSSREKFIDELFKAAGSELHVSVSYKRQLCNGDKGFTVELKESYRNRDNIESLTDFFMNYISQDRITDVVANFGIPESGKTDKKALSFALAMQFRKIVDSDEADADNVLSLNYQEAKGRGDEELKKTMPVSAYYPGDSIYLNSSYRPIYHVNVREDLTHTWSFDNVGTQTWINRRLFFSNHDSVNPSASSDYIDIPKTPPNGHVEISVTMNPEGFEEKTECKWIMVDKDGNDCFPRSSNFTIVIDAIFVYEE